MPARNRIKPSMTIVALVMASSAAPLGLAAAESVRLQPGLYEVDVRLELPHLEYTTTSRLKTLCLTSVGVGGNPGFAVLSENNPLAGCPISNVHYGDVHVTFDILCEGSNMGRGFAAFTLGPDRFAGRIAMKMGGKNMTMTEVQRGRRVGNCRDPNAPRS